MQFANPIWLWALAGLTLPVAIHLLSRKEGKVIRIGSLRHLHETNTQQFKGIRLNEIVLLSLRCLMIALFVFLMSGLNFHQTPTSEIKWLLVEKELEKHPDVESQLRNFQEQGYEFHWLSEGFPQDSTSVSQASNYRKLVEDLSKQNFSEAIVFSQNKSNGFSGTKTSLPSNVRWISVTPQPDEYVLQAVNKQDSVAVRTGFTQADKTYFTSQSVASAQWNKESVSPDTIEITLVSSKEHERDKKIVEAALRTIDQSFPTVLILNFTTPENVNFSDQDWCIWLANQPAPAHAANMIYLKPSVENKLFVKVDATSWALTNSLNEEVALNQNLTVQLAALILPTQKALEVANQKDITMLPDSVAWNYNPVARQAALPATSADRYLISLFLITLLIERLLAYYRNQ